MSALAAFLLGVLCTLALLALGAVWARRRWKKWLNSYSKEFLVGMLRQMANTTMGAVWVRHRRGPVCAHGIHIVSVDCGEIAAAIEAEDFDVHPFDPAEMAYVKGTGPLKNVN